MFPWWQSWHLHCSQQAQMLHEPQGGRVVEDHVVCSRKDASGPALTPAARTKSSQCQSNGTTTNGLVKVGCGSRMLAHMLVLSCSS